MPTRKPKNTVCVACIVSILIDCKYLLRPPIARSCPAVWVYFVFVTERIAWYLAVVASLKFPVSSTNRRRVAAAIAGSFCMHMLLFIFCKNRPQNGFTALIHAAMRGHIECVRLLLDAGADKEGKDEVRGI